MQSDIRLGERPATSDAPELRQRRATLSVCCMTSGRRPALLAAVLASLRAVADEIVVGVEAPHAEEVRAAVADTADVVLGFPRTAPADRPLAWLVAMCSGTWIFNIDDDEVPSPALLGALPDLARRRDITHAWIARRWLYPTPETYLANRPWGTEFQLRLFLGDERFLQFSDVFHRPVICHGPSAYVAHPVWHLDAVLNPAAKRRAKAAAYESERPGMRVEGLAHNAGFYLPELHPDLELLPVPDEDREAIAAALSFPATPQGLPRAPFIHASDAALDEHWVGPPYPESLYHAMVTVASPPGVMLAGVQHTVDVYVGNASMITWRWGADARPEIRLAYQWRRDGELIHEPNALRTTFPSDLEPGATQLVPVHVVAPQQPGDYVLELDLVHEHVRWFGQGPSMAVEVRNRERVAIVATAERLPEVVRELGLRPDVEPVIVLRDPDDRNAYGDYRAVTGLRGYLLDGTDRNGRISTFARLLWRTLQLTRRQRQRQWSHPGYEALLSVRSSTDRLVVDGPNWAPEAAFGREWWVVAATGLLWRLDGRVVEIGDGAMPSGPGIRTATVRWVLRRIRSTAG